MTSDTERLGGTIQDTSGRLSETSRDSSRLSAPVRAVRSDGARSACDRECGNCAHLLDVTHPEHKGRSFGMCNKLNVKRYVTDYCWRWEDIDGHVENGGARGSERR